MLAVVSMPRTLKDDPWPRGERRLAAMRMRTATPWSSSPPEARAPAARNAHGASVVLVHVGERLQRVRIPRPALLRVLQLEREEQLNEGKAPRRTDDPGALHVVR